jgi:hypothetical protein
MRAYPMKTWRLASHHLRIVLGVSLSLCLQSVPTGPLYSIALAAGTPQTKSQAGPPPAARLATVDCQECRFAISTTLPSYSIFFEIREVENNRKVIEALRVTREDRPSWEQILPVPLRGWDSFLKEEEIDIGVDDVNFDGYNDIFLLTGPTAQNSAYDYWLFDPVREEFVYLGKYPEFRLDRKKHALFTHETGGHAGLIHRDKEYQYIRGKLTLVRYVNQESTKESGVYRRSTHILKGGKLRLVKTELIKVPEMK